MAAWVQLWLSLHTKLAVREHIPQCEFTSSLQNRYSSATNTLSFQVHLREYYPELVLNMYSLERNYFNSWNQIEWMDGHIDGWSAAKCDVNEIL